MSASKGQRCLGPEHARLMVCNLGQNASNRVAREESKRRPLDDGKLHLRVGVRSRSTNPAHSSQSPLLFPGVLLNERELPRAEASHTAQQL